MVPTHNNQNSQGQGSPKKKGGVGWLKSPHWGPITKCRAKNSLHLNWNMDKILSNTYVNLKVSAKRSLDTKNSTVTGSGGLSK